MRALSLAAMPALSASIFISVPVPKLSSAMPGLSAALPGSSVAVPGSSAATLRLSIDVPGLSITVPGLCTAMPGFFVVVLGLSALASASVLVPGLSALVPLLASAPVFPGSSPLPFLALPLPKTPTPNLAAGKRRLDDIISGQSGRSKKVFSEELWNRRMKKPVSEEAFLPRALLFPLLFPSISIGERKFNKTFINYWFITYLLVICDVLSHFSHLCCLAIYI